MRTRTPLSSSLLATVLLLGLAPPASAANTLGMALVRYAGPGGADRHLIWFEADKDGAAACELTTLAGTFHLAEVDGTWTTGPDYAAVYGDLDTAAALSAVAETWTLVWDHQLPTQTLAFITLGPVQESQIPPVPVFVQPAAGAPIVDPTPNPPEIVWTYGAQDPCGATVDPASVCLRHWGDAEQCLETASCAATAFTPPAPLTAGTWSLSVELDVNVRFTPDGVDAIGDPWDIETESWGALVSVAWSDNEVVSGEALSFGAVKAMYGR